ncbi:MAG: class I adenylate-forming enzyme family protein [Actinomycetes bacterium]
MQYAEPWFEGAFEGRPEALAVEDGTVSLTAAALAARSREVAAELVGSRPRTVGLMLEPGCDWVVACHASWLSGAVVLPIDPTADRETLERRVSRCDLVLDSLPDGRNGFEPRPIDPLSPAAILYTSGTTAEPTEVMLSHSNLIAQGVASRHPLGGNEADRWLSSLSPTHSGGLTVPVRSSVWGCTAVIRPRFEVEAFHSLLSGSSEAITVVSLVPVMLERLLAAGLESPPTLRRAVVSGAPLEDSLKRRALEAGIPIVEAWGMTQTCGMATVEREPGSGGAGEALPGIHLEIAPDGEIRLGGATVAPGVQVGGMFDSGDLGRIAGGSLHVTGRKSGMIISGGENVSPERVELVLSAHPLVKEALVYGEADREWGEAVICELVLSGDCGDDELRSFCRSRLAAWEVPKRFDRVSVLHRTDSGKLLRRRGQASE